MRGLLSFCVNYARITKVYSLINKITLNFKKGINSLSKMRTNHNQCFFGDFLPSNIVKLENVGPTFSSFRPLLSYLSVATPVLNNFRDQYRTFRLSRVYTKENQVTSGIFHCIIIHFIRCLLHTHNRNNESEQIIQERAKLLNVTVSSLLCWILPSAFRIANKISYRYKLSRCCSGGGSLRILASKHSF